MSKISKILIKKIKKKLGVMEKFILLILKSLYFKKIRIY